MKERNKQSARKEEKEGKKERKTERRKYMIRVYSNHIASHHIIKLP